MLAWLCNFPAINGDKFVETDTRGWLESCQFL